MGQVVVGHDFTDEGGEVGARLGDINGRFAFEGGEALGLDRELRGELFARSGYPKLK